LLEASSSISIGVYPPSDLHMDDGARPAVLDLATLADGMARLFHRLVARLSLDEPRLARPYDPDGMLCPARPCTSTRASDTCMLAALAYEASLVS
jgi:hypothetical protein